MERFICVVFSSSSRNCENYLNLKKRNKTLVMNEWKTLRTIDTRGRLARSLILTSESLRSELWFIFFLLWFLFSSISFPSEAVKTTTKSRNSSSEWVFDVPSTLLSFPIIFYFLFIVAAFDSPSLMAHVKNRHKGPSTWDPCLLAHSLSSTHLLDTHSSYSWKSTIVASQVLLFLSLLPSEVLPPDNDLGQWALQNVLSPELQTVTISIWYTFTDS